jgi:hypothetical protein
MKLSLPILFILMTVNSSSQTKQHTITANDSAKLNMEFLMGSWANDSLKDNIQFVIQNTQLNLLIVDNYTYNFLKTDSFPLKGVSMTWPPHECIVSKLDKNHIDIQFTLFGGKPVTGRYKKVLGPALP